MRKKIILFVVILTAALVEISMLTHWLFHCKNFHDVTHLNLQSLLLQLQGEMSQDKGLPFVIIRFFHNKITDFTFTTLKLYFRFWDMLLQGELFPFVGVFGLIAAGWYFVTQKSKRLWQWLFLILLILLPFIEILLYAKVPFLIRIGLFLFAYGIASLLGIGKFTLSQKWAPVVILILAVISIWWLLVANFRFEVFCIQY
jgi:hypothetical protein